MGRWYCGDTISEVTLLASCSKRVFFLLLSVPSGEAVSFPDSDPGSAEGIVIDQKDGKSVRGKTAENCNSGWRHNHTGRESRCYLNVAALGSYSHILQFAESWEEFKRRVGVFFREHSLSYSTI